MVGCSSGWILYMSVRAFWLECCSSVDVLVRAAGWIECCSLRNYLIKLKLWNCICFNAILLERLVIVLENTSSLNDAAVRRIGPFFTAIHFVCGLWTLTSGLTLLQRSTSLCKLVRETNWHTLLHHLFRAPWIWGKVLGLVGPGLASSCSLLFIWNALIYLG